MSYANGGEKDEMDAQRGEWQWYKRRQTGDQGGAKPLNFESLEIPSSQGTLFHGTLVHRDDVAALGMQGMRIEPDMYHNGVV